MKSIFLNCFLGLLFFMINSRLIGQPLNSDSMLTAFYNQTERCVHKSLETIDKKENFSAVCFIQFMYVENSQETKVLFSTNTPEAVKESLRLNFDRVYLDSPEVMRVIRHRKRVLIPLYIYFHGNSKKSPPQDLLFSDLTQMLNFNFSNEKNFDWQVGENFEGLVLRPVLFETPHYRSEKYFKKEK